MMLDALHRRLIHDADFASVKWTDHSGGPVRPFVIRCIVETIGDYGPEIDHQQIAERSMHGYRTSQRAVCALKRQGAVLVSRTRHPTGERGSGPNSYVIVWSRLMELLKGKVPKATDDGSEFDWV